MTRLYFFEIPAFTDLHKRLFIIFALMKIRLTKEFGFEMSHALNNYDGLCSNIHGHSYKLFVTIKGEPIGDRNSPKYGMVMDFGDLKRIVQSKIIDVYDHALVLNTDSRVSRLCEQNEHQTRSIGISTYMRKSSFRLRRNHRSRTARGCRIAQTAIA